MPHEFELYKNKGNTPNFVLLSLISLFIVFLKDYLNNIAPNFQTSAQKYKCKQFDYFKAKLIDSN